MSLAGSSKLQFSKSISRAFRGVLGTIPVVNDGRAEVVPEGHRRVGIPRTPTLAQGAIAAGGDTEDTNMAILLLYQQPKLSERNMHRVPERVFNKSGANSFLEDFGDPALKIFQQVERSNLNK